MNILTTELIRQSEQEAVQSGRVSFPQLMELAGRTAADILAKEIGAHKKICVLCGPGNNGGDGCVIAAALYECGAAVSLLFPLGRPRSQPAALFYDRLPPLPVCETFEDRYDIIIDALFGIGLSRPLDTGLADLIRRVNAAHALKLAVDIPSGVSTDDGAVLGKAFRADRTVTFIAPKPCFFLPPGSDFCGEVTVADLGVPAAGSAFETLEKPLFAKRPHNAHKGSFGTALLFCGSYGMAGAAILSARAALRSGAGIVKCVLPDSIYPAFTAAVPEAVCLPTAPHPSGTLRADAVDLSAALERCQAVLFGCGLGGGAEIPSVLEALLTACSLPMVIDADGINALCGRIHLLQKSKAPVLLTPHPGEMARLCSCSVAEIERNRVAVARDFAVKNGCILILKGADTIIAEPSGAVRFNPTGNPGMATGGSGDVLAGMLVSLLAQGMSPAEAAGAAVYLHGEAGDKAARRKGERAMLPSDMIEEL